MKFNISRVGQDRWVFCSKEHFSRTKIMGLYDSEIVSISTNTTKALQDFPNNMHNRPDTTAESLAKLRPAF